MNWDNKFSPVYKQHRGSIMLLNKVFQIKKKLTYDLHIKWICNYISIRIYSGVCHYSRTNVKTWPGTMTWCYCFKSRVVSDGRLCPKNGCILLTISCTLCNVRGRIDDGWGLFIYNPKRMDKYENVDEYLQITKKNAKNIKINVRMLTKPFQHEGWKR